MLPPHIKEMTNNAGCYICGFPDMLGSTVIISDGKGGLLMPNTFKAIDPARINPKTVIEGPYTATENPPYIEYAKLDPKKPSLNSTRNVDQALFCDMVYQLDSCIKQLTNLLGCTKTSHLVPSEIWHEAHEVALNARKFIS